MKKDIDDLIRLSDIFYKNATSENYGGITKQAGPLDVMKRILPKLKNLFKKNPAKVNTNVVSKVNTNAIPTVNAPIIGNNGPQAPMLGSGFIGHKNNLNPGMSPAYQVNTPHKWTGPTLSGNIGQAPQVNQTNQANQANQGLSPSQFLNSIKNWKSLVNKKTIDDLRKNINLSNGQKAAVIGSIALIGGVGMFLTGRLPPTQDSSLGSLLSEGVKKTEVVGPDALISLKKVINDIDDISDKYASKNDIKKQLGDLKSKINALIKKIKYFENMYSVYDVTSYEDTLKLKAAAEDIKNNCNITIKSLTELSYGAKVPIDPQHRDNILETIELLTKIENQISSASSSN